jgi:hypothetical protein
MQSEQCREQQDAAIAILDIGGMNDGVQQQTQRVYENVALLALDLLARIIAVRIKAGPPCMGPFLSSSFGAGHVVLIGFFVRVRRETGKKSVVRVHHGEGVAIHIDPESCADAREGIGEALTGERIGQAIEP